LHHCGRVAADHAVDAGCPGICATSDRIVDPDPASLGELVGENFNGGGLTGRGPPVEHFGLLLCERAGTPNEGSSKGIRRDACVQAHSFLPEALLTIL
jgi:hypothetical protein